MNSYELRQWQIKEAPFRPFDLAHTETILTIGNGLVGVRGSFEEGYPTDSPTTLLAGIFNHKAGTLVPELVSMPNWLSLTIHVNGEAFRLDQGRILGYERVLNMKTGILTRGVLWLSPNRTILRLAFERFTSLANPHILALRVLIQPLSEGQHQLRMTSALDGRILNPGNVDHWANLHGEVSQDQLFINGTTDQSGYHVAMAAQLLSTHSGEWADESNPRCPAHSLTFQLNQNEKATITKLVSIHSSRDTDDPITAARTTLEQAVEVGYDKLKLDHESAWYDYWDQMDIVIEGDEVAQRAVRFCTYHLLIATPQYDERVSIAAKSLSGFGYKGHVFWDTEFFMLPPLTLAMPEAARRLLMYRYHNLDGARKKARANGYEGAMFPWESTDTGEETTPQWTDPHPVTGERVRIWTGDNEQHISSDIAYAVLQFWQWTGDDAWFVQYGAEIVLDTAVFWASRAEYNAEYDRYELRQQIGPDEYHENVDNSVFTNRLVAWHMQQALNVLDWLHQNHPQAAQRLEAQLNIQPQKWQDIAQKMWINVNQGVLEQFEGFFDRLQPFNLYDYTPRTANMDWILGHEKTQRVRVIKQADVVMLMAILWDELGDHDFLMRNWETYYPVVDHGSSLSPSIHAWVAARLGLLREAYDLFIYAATIDLEDHKGNVRDGIHAACCGGVWQAVVFGFCGLKLRDNEITLDPMLPKHWRRVAFKVVHQGRIIPIEITNT
ncbi:MAG: beta-phosphoglucomutase [Phototrophicales bacterium]|nr:MAG: beta-phosphoglucomutase [Phototrophicales bacterium]